MHPATRAKLLVTVLAMLLLAGLWVAMFVNVEGQVWAAALCLVVLTAAFALIVWGFDRRPAVPHERPPQTVDDDGPDGGDFPRIVG
jgi:hypothetical protein